MTDRQMIEELLHQLCVALPFVEDAQDDESYNEGVVKKRLKTILSAIEKAQKHLGEKP
jgi:hypothetical protein